MELLTIILMTLSVAAIVVGITLFVKRLRSKSFKNVAHKDSRPAQSEPKKKPEAARGGDIWVNAVIACGGIVVAISDIDYALDRTWVLVLVLIVLTMIGGYMLSNFYRCTNNAWRTAIGVLIALNITQSAFTGYFAQSSRSLAKDGEYQARESAIAAKQLYCDGLKRDKDEAQKAKNRDAERMIITPHVNHLTALRSDISRCQRELDQLMLSKSSKVYHGQAQIAQLVGGGITERDVVSITDSVIMALFLANLVGVILWTNGGMRKSRKRGLAGLMDENARHLELLMQSHAKSMSIVISEASKQQESSASDQITTIKKLGNVSKLQAPAPKKEPKL